MVSIKAVVANPGGAPTDVASSGCAMVVFDCMLPIILWKYVRHEKCCFEVFENH